MSKKNKHPKRAYKFTRKNGDWSIVIGLSKDSAKSEYKEYYNITDKEYEKEKIKSFIIKNKKQNVKSAFFDKKIPLEVIISHVKFPPRVICDNKD